MTLAEIAALLGLNLALVLAAMGALWALSLRSGRFGFLDGVWPLAIAALAGMTFLVAHGDPVRKGLLLWLVALWAAPQAWRRLAPRARADADARYAATAARVTARGGWSRGTAALLVFFLPQGLLAWLVALPVQLGQLDFLPAVGWVGWAGAVLAVTGIGLEGLGSLRPHAASTPVPGQTGARRWLKRPEYLGDLAVWWGLFLIAVETAPGRASVFGPIFLSVALAHWAQTENPRRMSDGG